MPTVHTWQYLEYIVEGEGDDQYITIYGYDSAENPEHPHVHIPAEIDHEGTDLPVKRIGVEEPDPETGEGAPFINAELTGVTMQEGIEHIGTIAFAYYPEFPGDPHDLGELDLPDSIKTIEGDPDIGGEGAGAFISAGVTGFKNGLPDNLEELGAKSFYNCDITGELNTTNCNNLLSIKQESFQLNSFIKVIIGNSVEVIEWRAFRQNDIEEVHLGTGMEGQFMEQRSFQTNNITKITIPKNITLHYEAVFRDNPGDFDGQYMDENDFNQQAGTYEWNETDEEWEKTGDYETPEEPEPPEVGVVGGYGGIRVGYRGLFGY